MKTTRKNFNFDSRLIEKAEMRASQTKRSLTAHIAYLLEKDLKESRDEFFNYISERQKGL